MSALLTRRQWAGGAVLAIGLALDACARIDPIDAARLRLLRHAERKRAPGPYDWLATHSEPGQTYAQFRQQVRTSASASFTTLRLVPIGPVTAAQQSVLDVVRDLLPAFFGMPLLLDPPVSVDSFPAVASRLLPGTDVPQLLTSYLLDTVLKARRRPADAAVLGITAIDLWPGNGWNFVFGQASLKERVGVWSMARNGDPDASEQDRVLCALRTAKTALHETGHMFGIRHCIAYECGMNGSNHSAERDLQPLEFCPECQAKIWWTVKLAPAKRAQDLGMISRRHGLLAEARHFEQEAAILSD